MEKVTDYETIVSEGNAGYPGSHPQFERRYAGFWIRVGASLLDGICLQAVFIFFHLLMGYNLLEPPTPVTLFESLLSLVYYVVMTVKWGQTLGKMATGIRVIRNDGSPNTVGIIILREFIGKLVSGLILCIGYMMAGWNREKTALHDLISGTRVIKVSN